MIPIVYDFLLFLMLLFLYLAGNGLRKNGGKLFSSSGLIAILAFTLNEGLRFGRGKDYNLYGTLYDTMVGGGVINKDIGLVFVYNTFASIGFPYQIFVILGSFMFILSSLFFLRLYPKCLHWSLPLFSLFSILNAENLICWYLGFSFILIGTSYLLHEKKRKITLFVIYGLIGCSFHIGLLLVLMFMYALSKIKSPILHPYISIPLYIAIGLFFRTDFMLEFVDIFNSISFLSERATEYVDDAEYWLSGGFGGRTTSAFPSVSMTVFLVLLLWYGKKVLHYDKSRNQVFVYNLFLLGVLLQPIATQIELLYRYDSVFLAFRGLLCAMIIDVIYVSKKSIKHGILSIFFAIMLFYSIFSFFKAPFVENENMYLYVWDKGNKTYEQMRSIIDDIEDDRSK